MFGHCALSGCFRFVGEDRLQVDAGVGLRLQIQLPFDLVEMLEPTVTVPIHYDDYGVFRSPLTDFLAEMIARHPATEVRVVQRGGTVPLDPAVRPAG